MQQICQNIKFYFILISAGYNLLWRDERITVKILEESVNFFDEKVNGRPEGWGKSSFQKKDKSNVAIRLFSSRKASKFMITL